VRVLVVAEYYPRAADPVSGVWAHRQALAARNAGAEVRVLVLHRPVPSLAAVKRLDVRAFGDVVRQPRAATLDGLDVGYIRYLSPPRPLSYGSWGAWAAPLLRRALARISAEFPFDLVHAHYAVPAGDAVRRAAPEAALAVSVHGHDVYGDGPRMPAVPTTLGHARIVLANSAGTAQRSSENGARATCVVHLGTDIPAAIARPPATPTLVSVGHLVARKRQGDVIAALALLRDRHPQLRCVIVGDGPERERLAALAASLGVDDRVELRGRLPHEQAVAVAQRGSLFVLPSVDEAFGVAYVEAMAAGVPAVGCLGEDGPAEIATAGGGIVLVPPRNEHALADALDGLLSDPVRLEVLGREARATVEREFTWERCGAATVEAYERALART
jgi:glycosyltransferase involved in cell wall biosynthesis